MALGVLLGIVGAKNNMSTSYYDTNESPLVIEEFVKTQAELLAKHGPPLKVVKVSSATLQAFPLAPFCNPQNLISTLYGVPVEIDESLDLFECRAVHG